MPYRGFISDFSVAFLVLVLFLKTKNPMTAAIIKKARTPAMDPMMGPVWGELLPEASSQLRTRSSFDFYWNFKVKVGNKLTISETKLPSFLFNMKRIYHDS